MCAEFGELLSDDQYRTYQEVVFVPLHGFVLFCFKRGSRFCLVFVFALIFTFVFVVRKQQRTCLSHQTRYVGDQDLERDWSGFDGVQAHEYSTSPL
jgi:hypothetical protein